MFKKHVDTYQVSTISLYYKNIIGIIWYPGSILWYFQERFFSIEHCILDRLHVSHDDSNAFLWKKTLNSSTIFSSFCLFVFFFLMNKFLLVYFHWLWSSFPPIFQSYSIICYGTICQISILANSQQPFFTHFGVFSEQ